MPWKERYTLCDERSLADADVHWPEGARLAANIVVDLNLATGREGISASDVRTDRAMFGLREGLDEILGALVRFGLKATFAVPAVIAEVLGDTLRELHGAGHEIAAHGLKGEDASGLERADEAARIALATEVLGDAVGERPVGWYALPRASDPFAVGMHGPRTMELVLEAGYTYLGNGLSDDIPHYCVTDFAARRAILTLPYYYHFDDQFFLLFPRAGTGLEHADALAANWRAELDAQYRRGRFFQMTLHPHAAGWCNRLELLQRFLADMTAYPGLWNATSAECARHWLETYPAQTHLKLASSIWEDHPGSLS